MEDTMSVRSGAWLCALAALSVLSMPGGSAAQSASPDQEPLGVGLEGFVYPYPVQYLTLRMDATDAKLAFMDVEPTATPNGRVVVLMHGRNFFGAYWKDTVHFLSTRGYRIIVPDQIGFGKSTKPDRPHSLHLHAHNTKLLLDTLNVKKAIIVAHSLGGMMATRFALMYPETVERLVLEDPLGLEDYRIKVPYVPPDELLQEARKQGAAANEALFKGYFVQWKLEYQIFPDVQTRWMLGPESELIARTAMHTYVMAYEQPVVYELPLVKTPTLIIVGDKDRTALGRTRVSPEVRATLGLMPELAKKAAASMPDCKVALIADVGHIPHVESPERFYEEVLRFIEPKR
jgi:pimeloyl-ACP methyl ester carboxylesterase